MFIALDSNKNRVSIENAEKGVQYFCPICGEPLIIRAKDSVAVKPHFAHKKGTDCDDFSHDMSEWHLNWQRQFPEECREVVVENNGKKQKNRDHRRDGERGQTTGRKDVRAADFERLRPDFLCGNPLRKRGRRSQKRGRESQLRDLRANAHRPF